MCGDQIEKNLSRMASETESLAIHREKTFDPSRITNPFGEKRYCPPPARDKILREFPILENRSDCGDSFVGCQNGTAQAIAK